MEKPLEKPQMEIIMVDVAMDVAMLGTTRGYSYSPMFGPKPTLYNQWSFVIKPVIMTSSPEKDHDTKSVNSLQMQNQPTQIIQ